MLTYICILHDKDLFAVFLYLSVYLPDYLYFATPGSNINIQFCQAQSKFQLCWTELAILSLHPSARPTIRPTIRKSILW